MTTEQRKIAREKNKVRTQKILVALEWLLLNHEEWRRQDISLDQYKQQLRNPTLIDRSREEEDSRESSSTNIESNEVFQVFFPDGTASTLTGGQDNLQQFQELVKAAQQSGFNVELKNDLMKEAVHDFRDNNLVNACLLQFPYGRGGLHELRSKGDGSLTTSVDIEEYVRHLSLISQPHFQEELFSLILYNMYVKQEMVRTAGFTVRSNVSANALANELTPEEVDAAISDRRSGTSHSAASTGRRFLNAIDAIARSVPHSSNAAKKARQDGEAHQHRFGMASFFLTAAVDDDNSLIVQILSGVKVDDEADIGSLTDDELASRAKHRSTICLRYPGICSFYFELVLHILIYDVIGWDLDNKRPTDFPGLFGVPEALVLAVEEQGRATLHTHIQVWIRQYNEWRDDLYSLSRHARRKAEDKIIEAIDAVSSTKLFTKQRCPLPRGSYGAWQHDCSESLERRRQAPQVVDDNSL